MPHESNAVRSHVPARAVWPLTAGISVAMLAVRLAFELSQHLADGNPLALGRTLFAEVTGSLVSVPYIFLAIHALRRWPLTTEDRWRWVLRLAVFFLAASALHAPILFAFRGAAAAVFGFHGFPLTPSLAQYVNEGINDLIPAVALAAGMTAAEFIMDARARERRAFALERSLLEAELRNVRLQLQPHFLFNALNTIAATMYDDPAAADAQLGQLSELLRASLRSANAQEVPLREEMELVGQYVGLMQARFPGALAWEVSLAPGVDELLVPSMVLQPLVENAVRHGALATRGAGRVEVTGQIVAGDADAPAAEGRLELRVRDDGPGLPPGRDSLGTGTGLSATARRLELLYGPRGTLAAGNVAGGGFEVVLHLPVTP